MLSLCCVIDQIGTIPVMYRSGDYFRGRRLYREYFILDSGLRAVLSVLCCIIVYQYDNVLW